MRLDAYLAKERPEYSRSTWQKYITQGFVSVNGQVKTSHRAPVGSEDTVVIDTIPVADFREKTLPIIYEDSHVVVVNKPSGVLTHAKGALTEEFSVAEFVRPRLQDLDTSNRPGIVHRLDRATSGVIICAKDFATKRKLQKQFQDRKAHKTYLAVVQGVPKLAEASVKLPIERNPRAPSRFRIGAKGKPATTNYRVLASNGTYSVLELKPLTGRTHQLRVHLAYVHCPIVGDTMYQGPKSPIGRLCLHALELEITIPTSQRKTFTAPVPDDFAAFLREVGYDF